MNKTILTVALSAAILGLAGCGSRNTDTTTTPTTTPPVAQQPEHDGIAKIGDTVNVNYIGSLEDGTIFDTSIPETAQEAGIYDEMRPYEPLTVNLGRGEVIPGFENGIAGMRVGETKTITLTADEAYGQPREELIQEVPADTFEGSDIVPEVGNTYNFGVAQGTILEISDEFITIDFNHPLAGQTLIFEVTVTDIIPNGAGDILGDNMGIDLEADMGMDADMGDDMGMDTEIQ